MSFRMWTLLHIHLLLHVVLLHLSPSHAFSNKNNVEPPVFLPTSPQGMVKQAASAISSALLQDGINLQTLRLPLSEAMYSESEEGFVADRAIGWQGGPQETYRFLAPIVRQVLQSTETISLEATGNGLVPRIQEQVLLNFDGSALVTSECPDGPLGDAQAMLQPNTDAYYPKLIKIIEPQLAANDTETGEIIQRLFLLVNPAWRDASSFGYFSARQAQKDILDRYETTYAVDQFVIRGKKCSVLKVWPHDWCVFGSNLPYDNNNSDENGGDGVTFLGSFPERPAYEVMDLLIQDALKQKRKD